MRVEKVCTVPLTMLADALMAEVFAHLRRHSPETSTILPRFRDVSAGEVHLRMVGPSSIMVPVLLPAPNRMLLTQTFWTELLPFRSGDGPRDRYSTGGVPSRVVRETRAAQASTKARCLRGPNSCATRQRQRPKRGWKNGPPSFNSGCSRLYTRRRGKHIVVDYPSRSRMRP